MVHHEQHNYLALLFHPPDRWVAVAIEEGDGEKAVDENEVEERVDDGRLGDVR